MPASLVGPLLLQPRAMAGPAQRDLVADVPAHGSLRSRRALASVEERRRLLDLCELLECLAPAGGCTFGHALIGPAGLLEGHASARYAECLEYDRDDGLEGCARTHAEVGDGKHTASLVGGSVRIADALGCD